MEVEDEWGVWDLFFLLCVEGVVLCYLPLESNLGVLRFPEEFPVFLDCGMGERFSQLII